MLGLSQYLTVLLAAAIGPAFAFPLGPGTSDSTANQVIRPRDETCKVSFDGLPIMQGFNATYAPKQWQRILIESFDRKATPTLVTTLFMSGHSTAYTIPPFLSPVTPLSQTGEKGISACYATLAGPRSSGKHSPKCIKSALSTLATYDPIKLESETITPNPTSFNVGGQPLTPGAQVIGAGPHTLSLDTSGGLSIDGTPTQYIHLLPPFCGSTSSSGTLDSGNGGPGTSTVWGSTQATDTSVSNTPLTTPKGTGQGENTATKSNKPPTSPGSAGRGGSTIASTPPISPGGSAQESKTEIRSNTSPTAPGSTGQGSKTGTKSNTSPTAPGTNGQGSKAGTRSNTSPTTPGTTGTKSNTSPTAPGTTGQGSKSGTKSNTSPTTPGTNGQGSKTGTRSNTSPTTPGTNGQGSKTGTRSGLHPSSTESRVLTLDSITFTVHGTSAQIGTAHLTRGGEVTVGTETISFKTDGGAIVADETTLSLSPETTDSPIDTSTNPTGSNTPSSRATPKPATASKSAEQVITLKDQTVTADPTGFLVGTTSLTPGGELTVGEDTMALETGGTLLVDGSTVPLTKGTKDNTQTAKQTSTSTEGWVTLSDSSTTGLYGTMSLTDLATLASPTSISTTYIISGTKTTSGFIFVHAGGIVYQHWPPATISPGSGGGGIAISDPIKVPEPKGPKCPSILKFLCGDSHTSSDNSGSDVDPDDTPNDNPEDDPKKSTEPTTQGTQTTAKSTTTSESSSTSCATSQTITDCAVTCSTVTATGQSGASTTCQTSCSQAAACSATGTTSTTVVSSTSDGSIATLGPEYIIYLDDIDNIPDDSVAKSIADEQRKLYASAASSATTGKTTEGTTMGSATTTGKTTGTRTTGSTSESTKTTASSTATEKSETETTSSTSEATTTSATTTTEEKETKTTTSDTSAATTGAPDLEIYIGMIDHTDISNALSTTWNVYVRDNRDGDDVGKSFKWCHSNGEIDADDDVSRNSWPPTIKFEELNEGNNDKAKKYPCAYTEGDDGPGTFICLGWEHEVQCTDDFDDAGEGMTGSDNGCSGVDTAFPRALCKVYTAAVK
ncbi:hypothetical protein N7481_003888 [Penicillium waksmanii]|uniref:uncharacterized protein n=1 Tax=Penicillium waksmanii TaxID=69791 RepID=UPI00254956D4|nr:uncharacterized protein N7481_003888 [Penicillium waksmanii]KAJ5988678.1 hypothetical protein N7481_003888 [Penicillium waksmanii]